MCDCLTFLSSSRNCFRRIRLCTLSYYNDNPKIKYYIWTWQEKNRGGYSAAGHHVRNTDCNCAVTVLRSWNTVDTGTFTIRSRFSHFSSAITAPTCPFILFDSCCPTKIAYTFPWSILYSFLSYKHNRNVVWTSNGIHSSSLRDDNIIL